MIVGAAGELPKPPAEPIKFLEDMDDTELADAVRPMSLIHFSDLIRALAWHACRFD
jgi:ubiquitin carboxyl-terminal hydrolase 14